MTAKPWESWDRSLGKYRYPVNLANFEDASKYPGWFRYDTGEGGPSETKAFEARFKELAPTHLEVWCEVVYWKLYSTPPARNKTTRKVISRLGRLVNPNLGYQEASAAEELWKLCHRYIENPSLDTFQQFRNRLLDSGIAVAATFPAFIDPHRFPMVDTQVARWARASRNLHDYSPIGPRLATCPGLGHKRLMDFDWDFVSSWTEWSRFTASKLTALTGREWRARDAEMAVFTAQRKGISLSPL